MGWDPTRHPLSFCRRICDGTRSGCGSGQGWVRPLFDASDLPHATAAERKAPGATSAAGGLLGLMEEEDATDGDD